MKSSFIELVRSAFGSRDAKFRQQLYIFLVCLVISIFVWFALKMANTYQAIIVLPIEYKNIPKNKILTGTSDSVLTLEIRDKGSELLRLKLLSHNVKVPVSLKYIRLTHANGSYQGYLMTSNILGAIEHDLQFSGKVTGIFPDTLHLFLVNEFSKKVPVTADFDIEFKKQYMQYGNIVFEPDSVIIKGPSEFTGSQQAASVGKIQLRELEQPVSLIRSFSSYGTRKLLVFDPSTVSITIPVEKYTESDMQVPVQVVNSGGKSIRTFPDKVSITYQVALKDYNDVPPDLFSVVADFEQVDLTNEKKVRVRLGPYPPTIKVTRITPEKVEFIILQ